LARRIPGDPGALGRRWPIPGLAAMGFGAKLRAQLVGGVVVKARQTAGTVAGRGRVTRSSKGGASRQARPLVGVER
jgi:hypothetical protein